MENLLLASAMLATTIATVSAQGVPGAHFLENWDLNQDGKVSLEDAAERRSDIFTMFDADENGELSGQEYELFDTTREEDAELNAGGHGQGGMRRAQQGLTREFTDLDENGVVSKDEFVSKTADWLALIDRNGDGTVTVEDFGPMK